MSEDFFYALVSGWFILAVFWVIIIMFISIRKPPKSKLTINMIINSVILFLILFLLIFLFK